MNMPPLQLRPRDLVLALPDVASPPEVYRRLTDTLERSDWDIPMLARVVEADPAVTARLLRLVNSPYFGMPRQVSSVAEAVGMLGAGALRSLVLASSVMERYRGVPAELLSVRDFWRRSLRVAVVAGLLADAAPAAGERQALLIAGLLHDIGAMVLCLTVPEAVREVLLAEPQAGHDGTLERRVLGSPRPLVGEALLEHWRLPPGIVAAVGYHPAPAEAPRNTPAAALLGLAVEFAAAPGEAEAGLVAGGDPRWTLAGAAPPDPAGLAQEAESGYRAMIALFEGAATADA